MAKLTHKLVERYFDGELSLRKSKQVERMLECSPEHRARLDELARVGDLLRLASAESMEDVSFEGFGARIAREINAQEAGPSWASRAGVWLSEFIENRRVVWIPAAATVGVLALALLIPASPTGPLPTSPASKNHGIQLHSGATPIGSYINTVDFGDWTGTHYAVNDDQGGTIGVVWINETVSTTQDTMK